MPTRPRLPSSVLGALALAAGAFCLPGPAAKAGAPEWIWPGRGDHVPRSVILAKHFEMAVEPASARLRLGADWCGAQVSINGDPAGGVDPFEDHLEVDVKQFLRAGKNRIEVRASATGGPAAVVVQLDGSSRDGEAWSIRSGTDWRARLAADSGDGVSRPAVSFGPLASLGWRQPDALPAIGAFDEYNQWKEALGAGDERTAARFSTLPDGFTLEQLRTATDEDGSWVGMAIDPQGRIIVAREDRGLLRFTIDKERPAVSGRELINDTLKECRGLLFARGSLYANANNSKALYRLRDTNDDDRFDEVTELMATGGGVGHGRNDLALGPDGMIHVIHGDSVEVPADATFRTPPVAETTRREGHLVRIDPDGSRREIVATGLRNPFGIDFHPDGEPFTYDADNESDMGLPFYRPTRVNHLVSGADYGWRQGGNSWPVHAPDSLPGNLDIGHGSPTAVKFGTRSNFPPPYRGALFILDWAYGRIIAVHTVARGASYTCRAETFLRGRPLNVTDLDFGPDGAMYFVTGGRKTRSTLYRIRYTGSGTAPRPPTAQERARAASSAKARALRRSLEQWHRPGTGRGAMDAIWANLGHPDPWIRHAARTALEHQPVATWRGRALAAPSADPGPAVTALLALARVEETQDLSAVAETLSTVRFETLPRRDRLAVLRACEICLRRGISPGDSTRDRLLRHFEAALPAASPAENRELARLLVQLHSPAAVPKCLALLARSGSQQEQLYYLDMLSRAGATPWTPAQRETFWRSLQSARTFDGDRSLAGFLDGIRKRALDGLTPAERDALAGLIAWKEPAPAEPPVVGARKLVRHWTVDELHDGLQAASAGRPPDFERGRSLYSAVLCIRCHQVGASGVPVGPNLSAVSSRFGRRDLLASLVEPSAVVADVFRNHVIVKKGAARETVVGRVIRNDFRRSVITIATNPFAPWQLSEVAKSEIASHEVSPVSPMPTGLLDTLTLDEIRDLLTFLEAGGDPRHPLYGTPDSP